MDLVTVREVKKLRQADVPDFRWREGDAWLAGGTWLFSEPQTHLRRLVDLQDLGWEPLVVTEEGLEIASTCKIAQLEAFPVPKEWPAAVLFAECAHCLLASFKILNVASVGGNICMSLPAGAMISLTSGLEGVCTILLRDGGIRRVPVTEFVTGDNKNVLQPGDLLRSIFLPASALRKRAAFRRMSMTHIGRSTALVIATLCPDSGEFVLTVTASTYRPIQMRFASLPTSTDLLSRIEAEIPEAMWFYDVHGSPEYRKHMTIYYAEQLRQELSEGAAR